MKYLKLYEQFRLILESSKQLPPCILIDGTSSAGKSHLSESLLSSGWVIIALDNFTGDKTANLRRFPFDHSGNGPDLKSAFDWHESILVDEKGNPSDRAKSGFEFLETSVGWGGHPHKNDIKGDKSDEKSWYMYQDCLYGRGQNRNFYYDLYNDSSNNEIVKKLKVEGYDVKKLIKPDKSEKPIGIIFDDLNEQMINYIPNLKHFILYAPLEVLNRNRNFRKESDPRGVDLILKQFEEKYKAITTKSKLDHIETGYTKELIMNLFDGDEYLETFCENMKIEEGKQYWFEEKKPLPNTIKINLRINNSLELDKNGNWDWKAIETNFLDKKGFSKKILENIQK